MLWQVDIHPGPGSADLVGRRVAAEAAELGLADSVAVSAAHGYLIEGELDKGQVTRLAAELLCDPVAEQWVVAPLGDAALCTPPGNSAHGAELVHVLLKPGVMDPVAQSAVAAIADLGIRAVAVRTLRKYWIRGLPPGKLPLVCGKLLANEAIEHVVAGPLAETSLGLGCAYALQLKRIAIRQLDDAALETLSRDGQLFLKLPEMRTIRDHFRAQDRDPTDAELETIAQTWSEHCSHKTLKGRIRYRDGSGEREFQNMLKETIFEATQQVRRSLGADDWCVSVFEDNAGVVRFDDEQHVVFKVETHNHPSALEPYGGANTGLGGVIRDALGTGLGARPVCNTDVFCFAPPDTPANLLPHGVLHPLRVMKGVVAGVRDYGNRMGIPTVNGAICFDPRYLGNPLVFCGTLGVLPAGKVRKQAQAGDAIVVVGGRTGRDGIHGATFSSAELTSESEAVSGGAVQIGNAITEKMLLDVILAARDRDLFHAITDCGAGGLSSAVGEMGEHIGAEVWLDRVPLKYEGLSYTEIWISEAQERMVLAVPENNCEAFAALCAAEGVESTVIGRFVPTGRLQLKYGGQKVADLEMAFLHGGRPVVVRDAVYTPAALEPWRSPKNTWDHTAILLRILGSLNVASKEWVIRQYDHEVQGGSVVKSLVGVERDGPSDAAVLRPVLGSRRAIVVGCGINATLGDFDTYLMAASAIDEAVRNCVAVGADPSRIALLDNFCWGDTDRPETLGSLVRAALACHDVAVALGTPFISGKDSLNNEYRYVDAGGDKQTIAIPPTLLISAVGQMEDAAKAVTMDLKEAGNALYQVGMTHDEIAGSQFARLEGAAGGVFPRIDPLMSRRTFAAVHATIHAGLVRACHDLSEGGLAVAAAEMAFAGGLGARIWLSAIPRGLQSENDADLVTLCLLFGESNSRFLCEVPNDAAAEFERLLREVPYGRIGEVTTAAQLEIVGETLVTSSPSKPLIAASIAELKEAWQRPLRW